MPVWRGDGGEAWKAASSVMMRLVGLDALERCAIVNGFLGLEDGRGGRVRDA